MEPKFFVGQEVCVRSEEEQMADGFEIDSYFKNDGLKAYVGRCGEIIRIREPYSYEADKRTYYEVSFVDETQMFLMHEIEPVYDGIQNEPASKEEIGSLYE